MNNKNDIVTNKIKIELDKLRPKLISDGGDIEFINFSNGIAKVRLLGECSTCQMAHLTMEHAIEAKIVSKIPEVKKVINVNLSFIK